MCPGESVFKTDPQAVKLCLQLLPVFATQSDGVTTEGVPNDLTEDQIHTDWILNLFPRIKQLQDKKKVFKKLVESSQV